MTHHIPTSHRSIKTFIASLLAYVLLTSQLTPVAFALNRSTVTPSGRQPDVAQKAASETPALGMTVTANAPAPVPVPLAMVPNITATKTDSYPSAPGGAQPGEVITYSVTITNSGTDATNVTLNDTVDPNTTIVGGSAKATPILFNDTYSVLGNVRIQVPDGVSDLLGNDVDPDSGTNAGLTITTLAGDASAPFAGTSTQGGQVTATVGDGSFAYNPAPGFTGTDTFTYTATDSDGNNSTATVTLTITGMIWFVNSAAGAGGDGRLTTPFNCLVGAGCFDPVAADDPGDNIFLYSGSYTGGLTFLANQKLIGQAASATLVSIAVVTVPTFSDALPSTGGASPVITTAIAATNALTVSAGGIVLRGFTVGNTTGAKILGSSFGTLTAGNNTSPDLVLSGSGQALNLTTGTFAATSAFISVATTSSGTQGISLAGVAGTVSFGSTTVSGAITQGILVGTTTANIAFGNTSVTGGTDGVSLQNNSSGTRTFGTLSVSGNSGVGFLHAIGGGATTVTGATTITNPTGIGIDVDGSNADLSFAATTVNKGSTGNIGVDLTNNATRTIGFTSLTVTTTNAFALNTNNSGTVNAGAGGSLTQSGAGGGAASLTNTALGLTFTSISSTNGANGIIISGGSGTLASGTTNLQNNAGVGLLMSSSAVAANFGNTTVNSSAGDGVDLSTNTGAITFADLDITPDANLRGLDALNNTGTITSTSGDIATTGAPAINISGPAGRTPLSMTLTNVDSTNSTTLGVDINLVSGNLTVNDAGVATNITNPTGVGIQVRNTASGTMNFGNTNVSGSGGTGVVLGTAGNGNAGAITFADLDIAPDSGQRALQATVNTGALTASSGTVTTTNNTAVEISGTSNASRTPLNFRLTTVAVAGGGNGIKLLNTSATGSPGGFRVLGNGGTCTNATPTCTGGQIANTTGADGATGGAAIRLDNVDTVVFTRMRLNDHANYAIRGINVNGFTLDTSVAHGVIGSNEGAPHSEGAINFDGTGSGFPGLSGSSAIINSDIRGGRLDNLRIDNSSGTLNLTISGSTFRETSAAVGSDNIFIEVDTSATAFISVTGSTFASTGGDHINLSLLNNAIGHLTFTGNTLTGGHAIGLGQGIFVFGATWDGTCRYNISNNVMSGTRQGHAIHTNKGSGIGTMEGTISGNTIGITGVAESGASESSGITVASRGTGGLHTALVSNNTIRQFDEFGINLEVGEDGGAIPSSSATLNVTVTGNNISEPGPNALHGIHLNSGILVTDDNTSCADIGGAGVLSNNVPNAANEVNGGSDIRPRQRQGTRVNMPGYGGTAFDNTAVNAYITARNSLTTVAASSNNNGSTANDGFFNTPGGAPCAQPTAPTLPSAPETAISATDETGDTGKAGASASLTEPTNTDSITSRPFISSPRQQAAAQVNTAAAARVVVGPQPAPASAPAPVKPNVLDEPLATPPVIVGDNLTWNVGTLPAGQSVTITFQVTVDNPFMGAMAQVSNQGTVTADGGISVLTDDPSVGGMNDPTVTPIAAPPDLFVRDASVAEPASGSTSMLFTLALSTPAPTGGIVVNLSTANGTATGGTCVAGDDYETVSGGTATFAVGEQIKTFPVTVCSDAITEGDETLFLNVNSAPGATIVDGQGLGTITANVAGTTLISELRTSGPGGAGDDFVEIYNNTDTPLTVAASDASAGYGLFKRGPDCNALPVLIGTIPNGTVIPARGHYLFVGSAYSLTAYAALNSTLAADIESDFNVGIFSTSNPLSISTANRLDAVGFIGSAGGICDVLREGTALPQALGSTSEYSFVREFTLVSNDVPTPTDGNDNAADFTLVSTTPSTPVGSTAAPRLGAPGPENIAGPNLKKYSQVGAQVIDPTLSASVAPNRARDTTPDPANNSTFGTLASRRTFTNNTGAPITRLRFRIYDITTFPSPVGTADLRVRTSTNATVTVTGVGSVTALATTLETPPAQPNSGGLNSSVAAGTVTMGTPLAPGASIHLNFLFGVQQSGSFRVFVFVEAVP